MEIQNRLLKRQIKRAYGENAELSPELLTLLKMVEDSYAHFEDDRKLLERSLEISSKEAQEITASLKEANEELEDFNHSVSHDLKTHAINVTSLVTMLKKYLKRGDEEKIEKVVEQLEKSGVSLSNIINGFLGVSRLERSLQGDRTIVSINKVVDYILEEQQVLIKKHNTSISLDLQEDRAYIAKEHLETILRNLVTNAIKYRKKGVAPILTISSKATEKYTELTITDNGIGMDLEKNRYRLFKMFTRLENRNNTEGTGVGLFMVKKLINKNRGDILVESEVGKGTTFTLKLVR